MPYFAKKRISDNVIVEKLCCELKPEDNEEFYFDPIINPSSVKTELETTNPDLEDERRIQEKIREIAVNEIKKEIPDFVDPGKRGKL